MDRTKDLLDKIDGLSSAAPLGSAKLSRLIGTVLHPDAARSNEYTLTYASAADEAKLFERIELRLPTPGAEDRSQLLILNVAPASCVTLNAVQGRHGEGELSVPTPHQPADSPVYLVYQKDWGKLSFGFSRDSSRCLRKVLLDVQLPG